MLFIGSFSINDVVKSYREKTVLKRYSWSLEHVHFATVCVPGLEQSLCIIMASFVFGACFVMQYLVTWFCNHLAEEERERADCFTLIVFLLQCDCLCSLSSSWCCGVCGIPRQYSFFPV